MMVAKSFLHGLMLGSFRISLVYLSLVFVMAALFWFLHTQGIDIKILHADPEKFTRSSAVSVINFIILTYSFFSLAIHCCNLWNILNFEVFLKSMNGNAEKSGRAFCLVAITFFASLLFRVIYEMRINCGCNDDPRIINLSQMIGLLPMIFNVLFLTSYFLMCFYFYYKLYFYCRIKALVGGGSTDLPLIERSKREWIIFFGEHKEYPHLEKKIWTPQLPCVKLMKTLK